MLGHLLCPISLPSTQPRPKLAFITGFKGNITNILKNFVASKLKKQNKKNITSYIVCISIRFMFHFTHLPMTIQTLQSLLSFSYAECLCVESCEICSVLLCNFEKMTPKQNREESQLSMTYVIWEYYGFQCS